MSSPDLRFWFDPVCPFAWMTSKWVRKVAAQRQYDVEWRFISLRLLNAHVDYDSHFPPEYAAGHTAGLRLLRVCARTRAEHGTDAVGRLYDQLGQRIWEQPSQGQADTAARVPQIAAEALAVAGLPAELVDALEDTSYDAELQASTEEALSLTGKDVGTPILHFQPPAGVARIPPSARRRTPPPRPAYSSTSTRVARSAGRTRRSTLAAEPRTPKAGRGVQNAVSAASTTLHLGPVLVAVVPFPEVFEQVAQASCTRSTRERSRRSDRRLFANHGEPSRALSC